jgi:hypothetical protein
MVSSLQEAENLSQSLYIVVYKDMKLGFLAGDTDHGTREVREIFKGGSVLGH